MIQAPKTPTQTADGAQYRSGDASIDGHCAVVADTAGQRCVTWSEVPRREHQAGSVATRQLATAQWLTVTRSPS